MRDRLHYQARYDQLVRSAANAITEVERRGFLELAERYKRLAETAGDDAGAAEDASAPRAVAAAQPVAP